MARRKLTHPTKAVTFRIREDLLAQFELLLTDPVAERSSYGKKSLIIEALIDRLIDSLRFGTETINVADLQKQFAIGDYYEQNRTT